MASKGRRAASSCASDAFPGGLYGKYKRATEFFLDWLLHARSTGVGATATSKTKKKSKSARGVGLDVYDNVVAAIAQNPTALSPTVEKLWARALEACETAITLRARVALFFPPDAPVGEDTHAHFLERLRAWLAKLQRAKAASFVAAKEEKPKTKAKARETRKEIDFTNYFAVLELPDDYFAGDADDTEPPATATSNPKLSHAMTSAQRQRMFDAAFDHDLNVEFSFMLMELEELLEAVHTVFLDVKHQKKTLIEATAVTKVAVDCAASVIARLQVRYPAIRTGYDMMTMIRDRIPTQEYEKLWDKVLEGWSDGGGDKKPRDQCPKYVPGSIIVDLVWVSNVLEGFVTALPSVKQANMMIGLVDDFTHYGSPYDEERTQHYVWPSMNPAPPFFGYQFPALYNKLVATRLAKLKPDPTTLEGWFLQFFDQVVTSRKATLPCVFLFICWARSVAVLQGNGGLCRTVGLSIMQRWDIEDRLRARHAVSAVNSSVDDLHTLLAKSLQYLEHANTTTLTVRANPLLAGCILLDHIFCIQRFSSNLILPMPRFQGFAHIYSAMVDRKLLDSIPMVEQVLQTYEHLLFSPTRATVVRGSFMRSFVTSAHKTAAASRRQPQRVQRKTSVHEDDFEFSRISQVYRVLIHNDFSELPVASWKTVLSTVSEVCAQELFDTRVLSRDILTLDGEIWTIFDSLCDVLNRRPDLEALVSSSKIPAGKANVDLSRELAVINPLLPFLDCIGDDGSLCTSADAVKYLNSTRQMLNTMSSEHVIKGYSRRAAAVIARHFKDLTRDDINRKYFVFPPTPDWIRIEFGDTSFIEGSAADVSKEVFAALMQTMESSDGPLQVEHLQRLKNAVIEQPHLLGHAGFNVSKELSTLLHQAAAGPARDRRLVEWLIGMGALYNEICVCRVGSARELMVASGFDPHQFPNMMAVHSAAKAGCMDTMRLLLEAGQFRDTNTVTFHTQESLLHLAVKHGHRDVYEYLASAPAEIRRKDAAGNFVQSLTSDKAWKREIIQLGLEQQQQADLKASIVKKRVPQLARESAAAAEQLRRSLAMQRDSERVTSDSVKQPRGLNDSRQMPSSAGA